MIVELRDLPLARYDGRIPGYPTTRPERGERIDLQAPAAQAYGRYLAEQREGLKGWLRRNAPNAQVVREFEIVAHWGEGPPRPLVVAGGPGGEAISR
ncbi:hypothetical protein [Thermoflexus sp.]|uniref:hypothetical protein n=1 Tax=Thermoflexus sp. TaxID=1969742 RepID=UPI002ADDE1B7|nr:hypothetical protein [Thermoflexus sp.]